MRLLLAGLLTALGLSNAIGATIDDLYKALETSDTGAVTGFVEEYYREAGISTNETLTWDSQNFIEIVNWYNQHTEVIMLSDLPSGKAEAEAYWQNWAEILTLGRWDWRAFFKDDADAALLANFNQFLLAAHEYGHALTYRFDPEHESRGGQEINCREYPADRLAAALLEELAEKDARIAALKARYRSLIDAINAEIAPEHRYTLPSFDVLDADCTVMHIEQPTDDPASMVPYASAFFVRHGLLQAQDLPPLAEVYEKHLLSHWRAARLPASARAGAVTTGATVDWRFGKSTTGLPEGGRHLAVDPAGRHYAVDAGYNTENRTATLAFRYGLSGAAEELVLPPTVLEGVRLSEYFGFFDVTGVIAFGPERFAAITGSILGNSPVQILDIARRDGVWTMRAVDLAPDPATWQETAGSALAWGSDGTPHAFVYNYDVGWTRYRLDPETLQPVGSVTFQYDNTAKPFAVGPDGESYLGADFQVVVVDPDGTVKNFAGAGFQGFKDNVDPHLAEFGLMYIDGRVHAGGIELFDYDYRVRKFVLRDVAWAAAVN